MVTLSEGEMHPDLVTNKGVLRPNLVLSQAVP